MSSVERSAYTPSATNRLFGLLGTCLIFLFLAAGLLIPFEVSVTPSKPSAALVVSVFPLASPAETPPKAKVAAKPVREHHKPPQPERIDPVVSPLIPKLTVSTPPPAPAAKPVDATPIEPETAAPKTVPAPPAPQVSSNAPDTWEGRVLARLQKYQRYPSEARGARQQGVVFIRFRIDREGHVLTSAIAKSSGFPALDQGALDTLNRADPLPKIPPDRPEEIEISVPVEFYLRR